MSRPFLLEQTLTAAELEELKAFLREKRRTVTEAHEWVLAKGYTLHRSAVGSWKASFDGEEAADRFRASSTLARAMTDAAKQEGSVGVLDMALEQLGLGLIETYNDAQANGTLSPEALSTLSLALQRQSYSKRQVETIRAKVREEEQKKAAAALDAGKKMAEEGAAAGTVVDKVREILGLDPLPAAAATGAA